MKRKQEFYVSPTIKVVEINVKHTLLAGSGETPDGGIKKMDEEYLFNE